MLSTNIKLYSIVFIDSLCLAFLPPIMAAHLMSMGGNHSILGMLGTLHAAAQLFSGSLIHLWNGFIGTKGSLLLSLLMYVAIYYFLGVTCSCLVFVLLRVCFALTNQTQSLCKRIAASANSSETTESINNLLNMVGVAGLIVAPIISCLVFDYLSFYYVTVIATLLLAVSFGMTFTLPSVNSSGETTPFMKKLDQDIICLLRTLRTAEFNKHSYLILLRTLYIASLTIFFIKFSYALKINQGLTFTTMGLTYAFQSVVTFLSTFTVNYFSPSLDEKALLRWLCVIGIALYTLSNTQMYVLYLSSFVALAVAHGVLTRLFRELFAHYKISNVEDSLIKLVSAVIPCVFGVACDFYGHTAYNTFVVLPIFCNVFIVFACIKVAKVENSAEEKEEATDKKKD